MCFSYLFIIPKQTQLCIIIRVKHQFIQFLPYGRHWNTLTMMQGKLERGPEEVVPREVVHSAPPSDGVFFKSKDTFVHDLFFFYYLNIAYYMPRLTKI